MQNSQAQARFLPPRLQFPQLPTFPSTVKSTSARSSACSFIVFNAWSALSLFALSSASSFCASPQVQSLQARRRLALGLHSVAADVSDEQQLECAELTNLNGSLEIILIQQGILIDQLVI